MSELKQIKIKYFDKDMQKLEKIHKGDLIDLRSAADIEMKKHGIEKKFPVQIQHLIPELDDYLLPVAIVTKSKMLQQFLKILSPFTFIPMGYCIGTVKDDKYF